jgi:hypothetical protein
MWHSAIDPWERDFSQELERVCQFLKRTIVQTSNGRLDPPRFSDNVLGERVYWEF